MSLAFAMRPHLRLGSDCVQRNRSAEGRSYTQKRDQLRTESPMRFEWVRSVSITPTTTLGSSSAGCAANLGAAEAVTATAHKLARIVYHMLRTKEPYNESVFLRHDHEATKRAQDRLRRHAAKLGFQIVPQPAETFPQ
jgi:hypothetical protein